MIRTLRGRLALTVGALALVAVGVVTVVVATTTNDALETTLADQRSARELILSELNTTALDVESWSEARGFVEALAEELNARIVVTDVDGLRLLDTGQGSLPPLEGVIDPLGPLAEFAEEVPFDFELFDSALVECLDDQAVAFELDELGEIVVFDDELSDLVDEIVDACYDVATAAVEREGVGVQEPALLFVGFDATPSIPWGVLGLVAAGVIVAAMAAAAPLSGLVTRSLRALAAATRSIRGGDLDVRVEADSPTEVAELAESFNAMTAELAGAEQRRRQLTADVAHELRSPLTNIIGHLDAIEDGVIAPEPDQIRVVSAEALHLARLVEDLQTLAAIDERTLVLDRLDVGVDDIADRAVDAHRARAIDAGIDVVRVGDRDAVADVDPTRLGQVIGNLLDNAIEHTPRGGRVIVAVGSTTDAVHVTVTDTGSGIDPSVLPRVFDRLSRADSARSPGTAGQGLGLAIARGLARAHGGDITAANQPEGGARFEVTIPRRTTPPG